MVEPISVPLLDLSAQIQPLAAELKDAFARVLDSSQFILGPEVAGFESLAAELVRGANTPLASAPALMLCFFL